MNVPTFDIEEHGTVAWFGTSWDAPVCNPATHIDTPRGELCFQCAQLISENDRGVAIPHLSIGAPSQWEPQHLACFLGNMGVQFIS